MPQISLPAGTFPSDYGDRLRAAGLGEGTAYGGSDLVYPASFTPDQVKTALALAAPASGVQLSPADLARFLNQTGQLPGLPEVGGDAGNTPTTPSQVTEDNPGGPNFSLPNIDISSPAVGAVGRGALGAGQLALAIAAMNPLAIASGASNVFSAGKDLATLQAQTKEAVDQTANIRDTMSQRALQNLEPEAPGIPAGGPSGSGTGSPAGPTGPGSSSSGVPGAADNSPGAVSGTGGPGPADSGPGPGDSGGGSGAPGDGPYARGGRVGAGSRRIRGSFKNAPRYSQGGMTRAQRVKAFESKYADAEV